MAFKLFKKDNFGYGTHQEFLIDDFEDLSEIEKNFDCELGDRAYTPDGKIYIRHSDNYDEDLWELVEIESDSEDSSGSENEPDVFTVTIKEKFSGGIVDYADKTYAEIDAAYKDGKLIVFKVDALVSDSGVDAGAECNVIAYPKVISSMMSSETVYQAVLMGAYPVGSSLSASRIYIKSDDTVTVESFALATNGTTLVTFTQTNGDSGTCSHSAYDISLAAGNGSAVVLKYVPVGGGNPEYYTFSGINGGTVYFSGSLKAIKSGDNSGKIQITTIDLLDVSGMGIFYAYKNTYTVTPDATT